MRLGLKAVFFAELVGILGCSRAPVYHVVAFTRQDNDTIIIQLRKGKERIKTSCLARQCVNLSLKVGNPVDCYAHPPSAQNLTAVLGSRDVIFDFYADESGIVCHESDGHGKVFMKYSETCVAAKLVPFERPVSKLPPGWTVGPTPVGQAEILGPHESTENAKLSMVEQALRAYVPDSFTPEQVRAYFSWLRQQKFAAVDSSGTLTTPWPPPYEGYYPALDDPPLYCHDDDKSKRYVDDNGKEVQDDTVLLKVLESNMEEH